MKIALVLGGGGPIGIAWEAGVLLGLKDYGIDLSGADRIIGTSAGSIVGSHVKLDGSPEPLFTEQATPLDPAMKAPKMGPFMAAMTRSTLFHRTVAGQRRSIGRSALKADVQGEGEWLAAIAGFLPEAAHAQERWPAGELWITAVDVETGERVVWTGASGVALPVAVASSCAVPCVYPLVHIGGRRYMDGGMGSPTNADLAQGCDLVVILDPLAHVLGRKSPMLAERDALVRLGSEVICFSFSDAARAVVGLHLMDASLRGPVAIKAREQGRADGRVLEQCILRKHGSGEGLA